VRIGFITHGLGTQGGIESVVYHLAKETARRGHQVLVFTCRLPTQPVEGLQIIPVRVPRLPFALWQVAFAFASARAVKKHQLDIVHAHVNTFAPVDVAVCHSVHSVGSKRVQALDPSFLRRAAHYLKSVAPLLNWLAGVNYRRRGLGAAVATSRGIGMELLGLYPALAGRMSLIPNGFDPSRRRPATPAKRRSLRKKMGLKSGSRRLLFIGKEFHRKGLEPAIRALALLPPQVGLWVIGDNVDSVPTSFYTGLATQLGVAGRVEFLGHQSELLPWYQAADAFVFPTLYEAFAMVSIEAMACGLPLLACETNGIEDLLRPGHNGAYVERSGESVAKQIRRWVLPPAAREKLARGARETSAGYTWKKIASRHVAVCRAVMDGSPIPGGRWQPPARWRR
jgi:UDP-glucose:(heptosyl)LPS alpha-1,3-glucosyltransferase